ncbi:hypothetical protein [Cupriavidus pinatubonensis]|uniref:Uncharacterized protein n=1 Tax=Cupriavidus pinatubonensis TaxID=248026 RepID=A0ABM8Y280_9BURK|nr:hypothetical protein [Cupriavidus pinatubonensis]QYY33990.1 hypothetical protein K2O51_34960 [Cupriavidus pinatubonensis]CAG9186862.1 hypothetical protein LMG23994_06417 [Cupriavidus pinatubonensis]
MPLDSQIAGVLRALEGAPPMETLVLDRLLPLICMAALSVRARAAITQKGQWIRQVMG